VVSELQPYVGSTSALVEWAHSATAAHGFAEKLAPTPFVSTTMRGKPYEVTAAILTGQEIGLAPMAALRSIDVIQGTPAMRAVAMRGLVQSRGHELWVEQSTDTKAVVSGRRAGSEHVQTSTWTIERAARLKLTGKDNWQKQPGAMLVARATAELCRLIASDVLLGIPYAVEELDDEPAAAPVKRARRKVVRVEAFSRPPEPDTPALEAPVVDGEPDEGDEGPELPEPEL
jgi:hypothetical protein